MMVYVKCDFCGADNAALVFQALDTNYHFEGIFNVVRCRQCGLVYLNPRPDENEIGLYYPEIDYTCFKTVLEPSGFCPDDPFMRAVSTLGIDRGYLCDIGCGVGNFLVAAQRSGWRVAGIEINNYARRLCNERLGEEAVFPSLEQAGFSSETFEVVTLWHVLEHLVSPRYVLVEINRIIKLGGMVALAVPNFGSLERRIWGANWIAIDAPRHLFHFTRPVLVRYLETCGFELICAYQQPGANSLASNLLRAFRVLFLDPFAERSGQTRVPQSLKTLPQVSQRHTEIYKVHEQTKDRVRNVTTQIVYPIAWVIARLHLGPELVIYARKAERIL